MTNGGIGKRGALGLCHRNVVVLHISYVAVTLIKGTKNLVTTLVIQIIQIPVLKTYCKH